MLEGTTLLYTSLALNGFFIWLVVAFIYGTLLENYSSIDDPFQGIFMMILWPIVLPLHIIKIICRFIGNL